MTNSWHAFPDFVIFSLIRLRLWPCLVARILYCRIGWYETAITNNNSLLGVGGLTKSVCFQPQLDGHIPYTRGRQGIQRKKYIYKVIKYIHTSYNE